MIYAIVNENGLVINRVVAGDGWVNETPNSSSVLETDTEYGIGGTLINGIYTPVFEPPKEVLPVISVTQRQARLALFQQGLLDQVEAAVTQAGGAVKITWDYAIDIHRDSPMITAVGQTLNLTSSQIDDLFTLASTL